MGALGHRIGILAPSLTPCSFYCVKRSARCVVCDTSSQLSPLPSELLCDQSHTPQDQFNRYPYLPPAGSETTLCQRKGLPIRWCSCAKHQSIQRERIRFSGTWQCSLSAVPGWHARNTVTIRVAEPLLGPSCSLPGTSKAC